jgi:hypothetical protein
MTEATEKLRPAAQRWIDARNREGIERSRIGARSGQMGASVGTHPALQPAIGERREALAYLFAAVLTSLRRGEEHSPAVMEIWGDYPELDRVQPHRDTPPAKRSQKQQSEVSRWAAGRKALTCQILSDLSLPTDLGVTPAKTSTTHPGAVARPKPAAGPSDEQIAGEIAMSRRK